MKFKKNEVEFETFFLVIIWLIRSFKISKNRSFLVNYLIKSYMPDYIQLYKKQARRVNYLHIKIKPKI